MYANVRQYTRIRWQLRRQVQTTASRLQRLESTDITHSETESMQRKSLFMKRKLNDGLNRTLTIFRDLDPKYSFLRVNPPIPNIDVQKISNSFWLKFASHTQDPLDLLEAWHLMARQDREEDELGGKEESLIRSYQEEQIIQKMISNFPRYSYHQLSHLTFNLEILRSKPELRKQFTSSLDLNLTKKMKKILRRPYCSSEDIDQCLATSFVLLRAGVDSVYREHRLRRGHNNSLVTLLLTRHLSSLTAPQLVFTLFQAGVQKVYPGCGYQATGQGYPLPSALYHKLCSVLESLTPHEVGVLCHSLHQVHLHLLTEHAAVRQAALRCLVNYPDTLILRDQFVVGSIAKFLMKRGSENHQYVLKVMEKFSPHLESIDTLNSIRLLQFILPGRPDSHQSRPFITALCKSLENRLADMRLKDLEKLAFGLYFLSHEDINRDMREKIANSMLNCNWSDVKSGKSFVFIVTFLAKMGKFDIESINKIISKANSNKSNMTNLETDEGLARAIGFLFDLNIPFVREVGTHFVLKFVQGNRILCRNCLFCLLELDCMRELYRIECLHLDLELRSALTDFFHSQPDFEFFSSREDYMDEDGRIQSSTFNEQTKGHVLRDLVTILGDERFVWSGHPFPHSTSSISLLRRDRRGTFKTFPSTFKMFSKTTLDNVREEEDVYTAVLVPSKGQQKYHGQFYGPLKTKVEHLKLLGYKPVVIHWPDYYRMFKDRKNLNYLRKIIEYKSS